MISQETKSGRGKRLARNVVASFSFWSLRTKVSLTILLCGLLILVSFTWFASFRLGQSLERELGLRLSSVAQSAVPMLPAYLVTDFVPGDRATRTYRNLRRKLLRLQDSTKVRRIYVFDQQKKSLLDTKIVPVGKEYFQLSFDQIEVEEAFAGKAKSSVLFRDQAGVLYKTGFAPIFDGKKVVAVVAVEGGASSFEVLQSTLRALFFFGLFILAFSVGVGFWISRWVIAPVGRLVESAKNIGQGELTQPVPTLSRDEIGFLGETMEEMRKNILARDNQMQMMLSGIAHEVRNPLGGMELFTGILLEELDEDDDEKRSHVQRIQRELRYLGNVVKSFLEYARPTALDIQAHEWDSFLFELRMLLGADLETKKIRIQTEGEEDVPMLSFDRSRMQQTLLNLLQNAIQASEPETTITVCTREEGEGYLIEVQDEGPGIPPETLKRIFEPFFTTKEKGTGLGLPLAKKFVESHDGELHIASEVGVGTTIRIWLPREPKVRNEEGMNLLLDC